ncbi:uncharacterized protein [Diadema antillarum]|uniref:uncharacterized protein n=1 Tax=Diadema antillarum TaxID=105358 RepID=UPI003A89FCF0
MAQGSGCSTRWVAFLLLMLIYVVKGADDRTVQAQSCDLKSNPGGCTGQAGSCSKDAPTSCLHGDCVKDRCICHPCWEGSRCDIAANKHAPIVEKMDDIYINRGDIARGREDRTLAFVMATDGDVDIRCREITCVCAEMVYSVLDHDGKRSAAFQIDNIGALSLRDPVQVLGSDQVDFTLTTRVSNSDGQQFTDIPLVVHIVEDDDSIGPEVERGHRVRRAVSDDDLIPVNENKTIDFTLSGVSSETNSSQLRAGIKVVFQLAMTVPAATYTEDVRIELYAEENDFSFGVLCPPNITHVGSNIKSERATPSYDFDSENPLLATAAYLNLGNVTNNNASSATEDSQIVIEFALTVLNDSRVGFSDDELRWITAGVEFASGILIWVGQLGYYLQPAETVSVNAPSVSLTPGPLDINILSFGVFTLDMYIYDMTSNVTVNVVTTEEGVASICNVGIQSTGGGYCLLNYDVKAQYSQDSRYGTNNAATFPFSQIINGGIVNDLSDSTISMEVVVRLPGNGQAVVGTTYNLGVLVNINDVQYSASSQLRAQTENNAVDTPNAADFEITSVNPMWSEVFVGGAIPFRVTLKIPEGKYNLQLESTVTYPSVLDATMCRAVVSSSGFNLPCISSTCPDCSNDITVVDSQLTNTLSLGAIRNTGSRSEEGDDQVEWDVYIGIPTSASINTDYDVTFKLKDVTNGDLVSSSSSFTVLNTVPSGQQIGSPFFNTTVTCGSGSSCQLPNGASAKVNVEVVLPAGATFSDISVRVTTTLQNNKELVGVCEGRVKSATTGMGCFPYNLENVDVTSTSSQGTYVREQVEVSSGIVSNLNANTSSIEEHFVVEFLIRRVVQDDADLTSQRTITVSASYNGGGNTALETFTVDGITDVTEWEKNCTNCVESDLTVTEPANNLVAPGTLATILLILTFSSDTSLASSVNVTVAESTVSILSMEGVVGGSNLPCGDPIYNEASYSSFDGDKTNRQAYLDLGVISAAMTSSSSVNLTLTVMLEGDRTTVTDGSQHSIRASVSSGPNADLTVAETSITADYNSAIPIVATLPNHAVDFVSVLAQDVEIGKTSSFIHSITPSADTSLGYRLEYETNMAWLEITDLTLTATGSSIGGLTSADLVTTYGSRAVSNIGFVACLDDDSTNCKIDFTVTVSARNDSGATHGDTANVTSRVVVYTGATEASDSEYLEFFAINATEIKNYTSTFQLGCPDSIATMSPGEKETCNITINLTDQDVQTSVEIITTLNISYVGLVVRSVVVSQVGSNIVSSLGDIVGRTATFTSYVNPSSSQKDRAKMSLGTLSNTETSLDAEANDIVIELTVQLTDSQEVFEASQHVLASGVSLDSAYVWVSNLYIEASRSGTEQPDLNVSYAIDSNDDNLLVGDIVRYRVVVQHTDSSSAEALNARLRVFLPPYMNFESVEEDESTNDASYPVTANDTNGLQFEFPNVYFTDVIAFLINCSISTSYSFKGQSPWRSVTPMQTSYNMLHRAGNSVPDGETLFAPMTEVSYSFTTSSATSNSYIPQATCESPSSLGMEDRSIEDCQISASSEPDPTAAAQNARLNTNTGWKTEARAGDFLFSRYLKVDLGRRVGLTGLATQGGAKVTGSDPTPEFEGDIAKFELLYSTDDVVYRKAQPADNEFDHSTVYVTPDPSTSQYDRVATHNLAYPVEARYVIIRLGEYDFNAANRLFNVLRTEFYGCPLEPMQTDTCSQSASLPEEFERGVLSDDQNSLGYVCDTQTDKTSGLQRDLDSVTSVFNKRLPTRRCTRLQGESSLAAKALSSKVRNIIGLDPSTNTLYGIAHDSSAPYYIMSSDSGLSWSAIPDSRWTDAQSAPGFVIYVDVPLESAEELVISDLGWLVNGTLVA